MSVRFGSQLNLTDEDTMELKKMTEESKDADITTLKGRYTNMLQGLLVKADTMIGAQEKSAAFMRSVAKYASIFVVVLALLSTTNFALNLRANEIAKESHVESKLMTDLEGNVVETAESKQVVSLYQAPVLPVALLATTIGRTIMYKGPSGRTIYDVVQRIEKDEDALEVTIVVTGGKLVVKPKQASLVVNGLPMPLCGELTCARLTVSNNTNLDAEIKSAVGDIAHRRLQSTCGEGFECLCGEQGAVCGMFEPKEDCDKDERRLAEVDGDCSDCVWCMYNGVLFGQLRDGVQTDNTVFTGITTYFDLIRVLEAKGQQAWEIYTHWHSFKEAFHTDADKQGWCTVATQPDSLLSIFMDELPTVSLAGAAEQTWGGDGPWADRTVAEVRAELDCPETPTPAILKAMQTAEIARCSPFLPPKMLRQLFGMVPENLDDVAPADPPYWLRSACPSELAACKADAACEVALAIHTDTSTSLQNEPAEALRTCAQAATAATGTDPCQDETTACKEDDACVALMMSTDTAAIDANAPLVALVTCLDAARRRALSDLGTANFTHRLRMLQDHNHGAARMLSSSHKTIVPGYCWPCVDARASCSGGTTLDACAVACTDDASCQAFAFTTMGSPPYGKLCIRFSDVCSVQHGPNWDSGYYVTYERPDSTPIPSSWEKKTLPGRCWYCHTWGQQVDTAVFGEANDDCLESAWAQTGDMCWASSTLQANMVRACRKFKSFINVISSGLVVSDHYLYGWDYHYAQCTVKAWADVVLKSDALADTDMVSCNYGSVNAIFGSLTDIGLMTFSGWEKYQYLQGTQLWDSPDLLCTNGMTAQKALSGVTCTLSNYPDDAKQYYECPIAIKMSTPKGTDTEAAWWILKEEISRNGPVVTGICACVEDVKKAKNDFYDMPAYHCNGCNAAFPYAGAPGFCYNQQEYAAQKGGPCDSWCQTNPSGNDGCNGCCGDWQAKACESSNRRLQYDHVFFGCSGSGCGERGACGWHAVRIVGYGEATDSEEEYVWLANSWGHGTGDYFKMTVSLWMEHTGMFWFTMPRDHNTKPDCSDNNQHRYDWFGHNNRLIQVDQGEIFFGLGGKGGGIFGLGGKGGGIFGLSR